MLGKKYLIVKNTLKRFKIERKEVDDKFFFLCRISIKNIGVKEFHEKAGCINIGYV